MVASATIKPAATRNAMPLSGMTNEQPVGVQALAWFYEAQAKA
jgi:hypothetical protein